MLFKELSKFIKNAIKFINGTQDLDKHLTPEEHKKLLKELRKAGIRIEE